MNRGALAHFVNPGSEIDDGDFPNFRTEQGHELKSSLNMRGEIMQTDLGAFNGGGPLDLSRGRAAQEHVVDVETTRIQDDGTIAVDDEGTEIATQDTDILHLEGEFIVTNDTESDFAHNLIEDATGGTLVNSELDLGTFAEEYPQADIWLGGFYDRDGPVEKGVHIGDLSGDTDAREFIDEAAINRLGVENFGYNGRSLKFLITESGYVDIYDSSVDTLEFVRFLHEIVVPHIAN
ncbi:hypothetical protein [Halobacterium sp. KA-6]|uniref:hypothetical protein n=1 Tax=Halobacterium sp. KA-6 TaxID=2896368 RepID=UPI001E2A3643|nr:hypothetical protein [Halobacterium sp. KA-6]MCD2202952.1 hypothetical protein [Halobacterium sp. KA-6]